MKAVAGTTSAAKQRAARRKEGAITRWLHNAAPARRPVPDTTTHVRVELQAKRVLRNVFLSLDVFWTF